METFEFKKNLQERYEEIESVLSYADLKVPAIQIRSEWKKFIEVAIEPTGWQALWRISRLICEEMKIKFPTVVFGYVEQVLFDELRANFRVIAVQDDEVTLPELHEVPLEELWPTKAQENPAINIDITAECVDRLRFFYNNIWMPWDNDNDEDADWIEKNLHSRIRFYCDLKNKSINPSLTSHILMLLSEARYIQNRREYLEIDLSEDDDNDDDSKMENKQVTDLMCLNLRMHMIKNEIEMLENKEMRRIYQLVKFPTNSDKIESCNKIEHVNYFCAGDICDADRNRLYNFVIVCGSGTLKKQIEYMDDIRKRVPENEKVTMSPNLQQALDSGKIANNIYIPCGHHSIRFLEYLNSNGSIRSVYEPILKVDNLNTEEHAAIIKSMNDDSILLTLDGDYMLENIVLDCHNVRTGLLIKNGNIILKNCVIIGDVNSSTKQGIVISGDSSILCENCIIQNFATGIYSDNDPKIILKNATIDNCVNGIELFNKCDVKFDSVTISNSKKFAVWFETNNWESEIKKTVYQSFNEIDDFQEITGTCEFKNNASGNLVIVNNKHSAFNSSCFQFDETDQLSYENNSFKMNQSVISINDSDLSITAYLADSSGIPIECDNSIVEID